MFTDLHTHLLPGVDDGPKYSAQALALAQAALQNGITSLAVTPHFYAWRHSFEERLTTRDRQLDAFLALLKQEHCGFEKIAAGFEVAYFKSIATCEELDWLTIGGSRYLLLELNGGAVSGTLVAHLQALCDRGFKVVLAHLERFVNYRGFEKLIPLLKRQELLAQINADSIFKFFSRRAVKALLDEGLVHLLASDMHSVAKRPPKMAEAFEWLSKNYGSRLCGQLNENAAKILSESLGAGFKEF